MAAALLLAWTGSAEAGPSSSLSLVGFSADNAIALVRYQVNVAGSTPSEDQTWVSIVRVHLEKQEVLARHDVLTSADFAEWRKAHPEGDDDQREKAMASLRGRRWRELEKLLVADGFKVQPQYKAVAKKGSGTSAVFSLPGGISLRLRCGSAPDREDEEECALEGRRAAKSQELDEPFRISRSAGAGGWIESVYLDPPKRFVVLLYSGGGIGKEPRVDPETSLGIRTFELGSFTEALK